MLFAVGGCQRREMGGSSTATGGIHGAGVEERESDAGAPKGGRSQPSSSVISERSAQDLEAGARALVAPDQQRLRASVLARAQEMLSPGIDGSDGWVLAHAVLGFGSDFRVGEHEAWRILVSEHGKVDEVTGRITFREAPTGVPIEPHLGLVAKTFASAGVDPASVVRASNGVEARVGQVEVSPTGWPTPRDLSAAAPSLLPGVPGRLDDVAWVLEVSARWGGAANTELRGALAERALSGLYALYRPIEQARSSGAALRRDGRGVFALTCGGAHLLQAVFAAYDAAGGERLERRKLSHLWSLAQWRYDRELESIDALLVVPSADRRALLGQRLKLTGHFLETLRVVESSRLIDDRARYEARLAKVESEVIATLAVLEERGAFAGLTGATERWSQADRDLVGDALHGARGLRLGL